MRVPFNTQCKLFFLNSCERPEQKVTIAVGTLQKQVKTSEERHMEMQEDIRKRQEALKKSMERQVVVFHTLYMLGIC